MLTSPKEESALALVIPRNTCELLSLISLQLALERQGIYYPIASPEIVSSSAFFSCVFVLW